MKNIIYLLMILLHTPMLFSGVSDFNESHKICLSLDYSKQDKMLYVTLSNNGNVAVVFSDGLFNRVKYERTALDMRIYCVYADGTTEGNNEPFMPEYNVGFSDKLIPSVKKTLDDCAQHLFPKQAMSRTFSSKAVLDAFNKVFKPGIKTRTKYVIRVHTGIYSKEQDRYRHNIFLCTMACILEIPADDF